ncbi:MAG: hypothetical protein Q8R78_04325 [Candidatus Omnitrophota bacterium]|nr:hypothetical protein [Candidatus Omnitrophota bacterium]
MARPGGARGVPGGLLQAGGGADRGGEAVIAAIYVLKDGPYVGLPDVDPWDEARDARRYAGPWSVVAHPPCARWGRYWSGGPSAAVRYPGKYKKGDDGGCFEAALASVRRWGGALEHPAASHAWSRFHIVKPPRNGGWVPAGLLHPGAWTCCVEQGHYGHLARKATWLYLCGVESPPELKWGTSGQRLKIDDGYHSAEERRRAVRTERCQRLSRRQRAETPVAFRDLLLDMARNARKP